MQINGYVIHTDGACKGNPGPGGWGAVIETNGTQEIISGGEPQTTNNRMELMALIEAYEMLPADAEIPVFSDSQLCVSTVNEWA